MPTKMSFYTEDKHCTKMFGSEAELTSEHCLVMCISWGGCDIYVYIPST